MQLSIGVRTLSGPDKIWIDCHSDDTVEQFQALLQQRQGTPPQDQVLLCRAAGGGEMVPRTFLRDYGFQEEDEVLLVRSLPQRPAGPPPELRVPPRGRRHSGKRRGAPRCGKGRQPERVKPLPPRPLCDPPDPFAPAPAAGASARGRELSGQGAAPAPAPSASAGASLGACSAGSSARGSAAATPLSAVPPPAALQDPPWQPPEGPVLMAPQGRVSSASTTSAGAVPSGTTSAGAVPSGTTSAGAMPSGTANAGAVPSGILSAGAVPSGTNSAGAVPSGTLSAGAVPSGTLSRCGSSRSGRLQPPPSQPPSAPQQAEGQGPQPPPALHAFAFHGWGGSGDGASLSSSSGGGSSATSASVDSSRTSTAGPCQPPAQPTVAAPPQWALAAPVAAPALPPPQQQQQQGAQQLPQPPQALAQPTSQQHPPPQSAPRPAAAHPPPPRQQPQQAPPEAATCQPVAAPGPSRAPSVGRAAPAAVAAAVPVLREPAGALSLSPRVVASGAPLMQAPALAVAGQASPRTSPRASPMASPQASPRAFPAAARPPALAASQSWSPPCTAGVAAPLPQGPPAAKGGARAAAAPAGGAPAATHRVASAGPGHSAAPLARIRRADLQRIGRLGVGAFGVVTLEADRRTGRTYALKAVSKGYLQQLHMEYSVLNEKRILKMLDTPFVVRLLATYNGKEYVYFLLEAALGGELFTTYERLRLYGSERHARFYVGCVTEALTHLHEHNVIYRDLKPENLLLDSRGYCKVTDMGLAKVATGKTYTLVGTPDYMAPEVIGQTGHTKMVDWWMLGVLLYELLSGHAPFEADSTPQVYELVKRGIDQAHFPAACRGTAQELVRALCRPQPEGRLRAPKLCEHAWFSGGRDGFDWTALRNQALPAPHVPQVRGARDLANFRTCEGEDPPSTAYRDQGSGWDADFEDDTIASRSPATRALLGLDQAAHAPGQSMMGRQQERGGQFLVLSPRQAELRQAPRQPAALAGPSVTKLSNSPPKGARLQQMAANGCAATSGRGTPRTSPPSSPTRMLGGA